MRHLADFFFVISAQRQNGAAQQVLLQSPQGIALIFGFINALADKIPAVGMLVYLCIMTGCNKIAAQWHRLFS